MPNDPMSQEQALSNDEHVPLDSVERLSLMTPEEVDDLPYGFIVLDSEGDILLYNRYESRMSRISPEDVLGRNFFKDVAPCTRVESFYGRFRALIEDPNKQSDRFAFRFHFLHGAQDVTVQFMRAPGSIEAPPSSVAAMHGPRGTEDPHRDTRVFMTVARRVISLEGADEPESELHLDRDRGRLLGPLGVVFPLGADQMAGMLSRVGTTAARIIGREIGRAIAGVAEHEAQRSGEATIAEAPVLLSAGALDDALARAGFGRFALDLTPRADNGVVGCLVRPSIELPSRELAALYCGLLEAALSIALGNPMRARCLDERSLASFPWRFALAPRNAADVLDPQPGERANDVARRLGVLTDD